MGMLNKLLSDRSLPNISVGIGMSTAKELVIKAGRKNVGINSKVWIGKAVTTASNLSSLGNKNGRKSLVYSVCSYNNFIEGLKERNKDKKNEMNIICTIQILSLFKCHTLLSLFTFSLYKLVVLQG